MQPSFLNPLSCRKYTELASCKLDRPLTFLERAVYRFHHCICLMCRRFNRQIELIQRAAHDGLGEGTADPSQALSAEARCRITERLRQARGE